MFKVYNELSVLVMVTDYEDEADFFAWLHDGYYTKGQEERRIKMAGRMETQKTLFLDKKDYNTFMDFTFLIVDLVSNLDEEELDELQEALEQFVNRVNVQMEED